MMTPAEARAKADQYMRVHRFVEIYRGWFVYRDPNDIRLTHIAICWTDDGWEETEWEESLLELTRVLDDLPVPRQWFGFEESAPTGLLRTLSNRPGELYSWPAPGSMKPSSNG